jgi:AcrR family transcriptional regulator
MEDRDGRTGRLETTPLTGRLPRLLTTGLSDLRNEERRAAIIKAVRRVFAEKGFDGTATRELPVAAGVSTG